jgi:hypothetical protein
MANLVPATLCIALALTIAAPTLAAGAEEDWPCIQRRVPELAPAAVWGGPPLPAPTGQAADPAVTALVERISSRRTPVEEAEAAVAEFIEQVAEAEREAKLTAVFAELFDRLNRERSELMAGIERYGRKQKALAAQIRQEANALNDTRRTGQAEAQEIAERQEKLNWDTRIFNERRASLTYVCEVPVLIEQRLGRLARAIENGLR